MGSDPVVDAGPSWEVEGLVKAAASGAQAKFQERNLNHMATFPTFRVLVYLWNVEMVQTT